MILVDTSVWIDYFNGFDTWQANRLDWLLSNEEIVIADLILTETLAGLQRERDYRMADHYLYELECVELGGKKMAQKAVDLHRTLRDNGVSVRKTVDLLIAAWCLEHDAELLHNEEAFERISEVVPLRVIQA